MLRACFLDRDGVLITEKNYLADPADVEIQPCAIEAVRLLHRNGFLAIVVSNQSGIARGYFTPDDLKRVERRIDALFAEAGEKIDAWYYCFHHPKGSVPGYARPCSCRKPEPGMLLQAGKDFQIDLTQSFMIGDKTDDLEAGLRAGCKAAALVRTGHGAEQDMTPYRDKTNVLDTADVLSAVKSLFEI